ncbi:MAG TPA: alkaline phosphatase family protein [Thermoanaerobaculia bacterium]|nr:alkaline phosphatase family protein [Thermoanaerobaculia bacterium]
MRRPRRSGSAALLGSLVVGLLALPSCRESAPDRVRLLVVGVDGADWEAIEKLWGEGRLPNLRALAERGVATRLATAYGKSPVIWTTMATGVAPERHGIEGFVVPTEQGDLPVSSAVRRVPALWNMLSDRGLRVGVVSWWASWPAEDVNGVVLSDRVVSGDRLAAVSARVSPAALEGRLAGWLAQALAAEEPSFEREEVGARDRLSVTVGRHLLASEDLDLVMVYLRSVDVWSHLSWKRFEPERFGLSEAERVRGSDPVTDAYEASDQAIGLLMEAAGPEWNALVVSDHGFVAMEREEVRVGLDLDRLLAELGFLVRDERGAVDLEASRAYSYASRPGDEIKKLRTGGAAGPELRVELEAALDRVRWGDGARTLRVRDARALERRAGAEIVVRVLRPGADERLMLDGGSGSPTPIEGVVRSVHRQSGTHYRETPGILFASGPHVDPTAELDGASIHDFAPTVLAAFGLPVAEDFVGAARRELFTGELRARHPASKIASWGDRAGVAAPAASSIDEEILQDLRALGYLDD